MIALVIIAPIALAIAAALALALSRVTAERDRLSAELDQAHLAGAALSVDRGSAAVWRRRAQIALRVSAGRRAP